MKSLKKSVIAVLVIGALSAAGMAFAQPMQGRGQYGPMGSFGGPRHMGMGQWNSGNLPPAPCETDAPCGYGQGFSDRGFGNGRGPAFGGRGWGGPCGGQRGMFAPNMLQGFCGQGFGRGRGHAFGQGMRGPRGGRFQRQGMFAPDMPQEIRAKAIEAAKLRIDLEDVLSQKPLNKNKAIELNGKIGQLKQEIRDWRFEQKLNRIEEFHKKPVEDAEGPEQSDGK